MKRRDPKGILLKKGESYRKDGRYEYRYSDSTGKRYCVYAKTLSKLRQEEERIEAAGKQNENYAAGSITVLELVERYISLRQGVRYNTKAGFNFVKNLLKKEEFASRKIRDIKVSDAKLWIIKLHNDGRRYSTLTSVRGVLKPAFDMAYEEEIIHRNPFLFKITNVVPNDSERRIAMTDNQLKTLMNFYKTDKTYCKYYDQFVVLLETGVRVSELCGLTLKDIDFDNRKIRVERQLSKEKNGKYFIEETKTKNGKRFIPMSDDCFNALKNIIANRPKLKVEPIIDGYTGFLFIDKKNKPKVALHVENNLKMGLDKYKKLHPDNPLPSITPHVFRHTFCTNLARSGIDIKSLQYLMGHSDVGTTMNVYTHANYESAAIQFNKVKTTTQMTTENVSCM